MTRVLSLSRRIVRALLISLVGTVVLGIALHAVTVYTSITYAQIGEWVLKGFAPVGALWVVAERKISAWKKEERDQRALRAAEEAAVAKKALESQEYANKERTEIRDSVAKLNGTVGHVAEQVQKLVDDSTNNDGSTQRDRNDLMFSWIHSIGNLLASTTSAAMWWASVDGKGNIVPTKVSDRFHRLTGMSHEQTANSGWLNFVHPDDQLRMQEVVEGAFRRGRPAQDEYRNYNIVTEEIKPCRMYVQPSCNPQTRKVIGWTMECYELDDPAMHMHRRATDVPNREALT